MIMQIRYKQRFSNYKSALGHLKDAVNLRDKRELSYLEKQGLIQAFEFTFELSWKVLKDFFEYRGNSQKIYGSRDAFMEAISMGILSNSHSWMKMIKSRNLTSHIYDEDLIEDIIKEICDDYIIRFGEFEKYMEKL
jgi:nucleotidyltransferase substrate binding protein (TIGR01987 family)